MVTSNPNKPASAWERAAGATPELQQTFERRRRVLGCLLGAGLGLSYGLVSQLINRVALPGAPLYQPPLGPLGNIGLHGLVGAGLGFLTSQPSSAALGTLFGSLAAAAAVFVSILQRIGSLTNAGGAVIASVIFAIPIAWLAVPLVALLRWTAGRTVELSRDNAPLWVRLRAPLMLVLVLAALAAFDLLPGEARSQIKHMDALVQAGLQASTAEDLPAVLRGPLVADFASNSNRDYTLEWTNLDLDRFIELRPPSSYDQHAAVIARFAGDYNLVCLYPTPKSQPNCGAYQVP